MDNGEDLITAQVLADTLGLSEAKAYTYQDSP